MLTRSRKSCEKMQKQVDVYEFTFDPKEEPAKKKKRTRVTKKKGTKPKTVIWKCNYDRNLAKSLAGLKNLVAQKETTQVQKEKLPEDKVKPNNVKNIAVDKRIKSVPIPEIAADVEAVPELSNNINYSPTNDAYNLSRDHGTAPSNDPLNLRDEISFFDDIPAANSSMNGSIRHPTASPWRVEFQELPIKWQNDTYVKPNMTPAIECSFVNDCTKSAKKHVYTNMVTETNKPLPQIFEKDTENLMKKSIISYYKEVIEKSAQKNKRQRSVSPTKVNSIFEDTCHSITENRLKHSENSSVLNDSENISPQKQYSTLHKQKNDIELLVPLKTPLKDNNRHTYFGFDDTENQENVSPIKKANQRMRALRSKSRAVLQEINHGPMRANIPIAKAKFAANTEAVSKLYEELKTAEVAPLVPEKKNAENNVTSSNIDHTNLDNEDDNYSVHLFEDIELVHHLKPTRKSYEKPKKVTFHHESDDEDSDSETSRCAEIEDSSNKGDLWDLTFKMPTEKPKKVIKKKQKKKQMVSKKEKQEADAWAAGFNSMCAEVDEFPLVVE